MLFNSWLFILVYMPLAIGGALVLRRSLGPSATVVWLGAASLVFYAATSLEHLPLLVISIVANHAFASRIVQTRQGERRSRLWLVLGLVFNLGALFAFKYAGFVTQVVNDALGTTLAIPAPGLPVGISFFTFTQVAYLVDMHVRASRPHSGAHYLLFVSYFPHLVAGPILRHDETIRQFSGERFARGLPADMERGAALFAIGLAKKVLIADSLAPYADAAFLAADQGVQLSVWEAWLGLLSYTFQIYFDFSGYSDMALGLSLMLGIDIPVNFRSPYKASSIIEFWRRWHISLSNFLREYLYIPLGGNRLGSGRRNMNLMTTMVLGGLWHGAGWGFIAWGAIHGICLVINHLWREHLSSRLHMPRAIGVALTFLAVVLAWAFFRATTFEGALNMIASAACAHGIALPQSLAGADAMQRWIPWVQLNASGMFPNDLTESKPAWAATVILAAMIAWAAPNSVELTRADSTPPDLSKRTILAAGVLLAIALTMLSRESPFLYFQF
jgi:alginate O-acetyltransferase complex protein AlgI